MNDNGKLPSSEPAPAVQWCGRVYAQENKSLWKARFTALLGDGGGQREIAHCEIEVFEGGCAMLRQCAEPIKALIEQLCTKELSGLLLVK